MISKLWNCGIYLLSSPPRLKIPQFLFSVFPAAVRFRLLPEKSDFSAITEKFFLFFDYFSGKNHFVGLY